MDITLINHACARITCNGVGILCDPWLDGPVFNEGWDLLIPTPLGVSEIMDRVTHIWISHEHPDHFSPGFFSTIAPNYRDKVQILFQHTRDRRVVKFLAAKGFSVRECGSHEVIPIGAGVEARVIAHDFYDSCLWLSDGRTSALNINDCDMVEEGSLRRLCKTTGRPDVLLTQFSYAAWKGGRENAEFRRSAARRKLDGIKAQIRILEPRSVIPFASLVYFSSVENSYLNDSVNTPRTAASAIEAAGAGPVVLYPGDCWKVGEPWASERALDRYDATYGALSSMPLREPGSSIPLAELRVRYGRFRERVQAKNAPWLMTLLRHVPGIGAFRPVGVYLTDLDIGVSVSPVDGLSQVDRAAYETTMHSSSLAFILDNEFGFDTLTVNGRFEATPAGFAKLTRSLSIGSLNAMGLAVSPAMLFQLRIVALLLRKLARVLDQLRGPAVARNRTRTHTG